MGTNYISETVITYIRISPKFIFTKIYIIESTNKYTKLKAK